MEPLSKKLRSALKKAHPGLTDEAIDEFEAMLIERVELDRVADREQIVRLDAARRAFIAENMPRAREIMIAHDQQENRPRPRKRRVKVKRKR